MILTLEGGLLAQAMIVALVRVTFLKEIWHEFRGLDTEQTNFLDRGIFFLSKIKGAITVQKQSGGIEWALYKLDKRLMEPQTR